MTVGTTTETDAEVAAKLIAARPRPARYRWTCKRCGNPQDAEERPPSLQLCARCRSIVLDMHTEPATRPVYGDESEDDGLPITGPAPSEGIQSDTSPSEAEAPKNKNAEEEVKMTATVEAPKKAEKPKAIEKKAQPAIPATTCLNPKCGAPVVQTGHGRRAIYCSGRCKDVVQKARARQRDKEAKAPAAGPFSCPNRPETFELERQRNGHLAWCKDVQPAAPTPYKPGSVADLASKGDAQAQVDLDKPEPLFTEVAPAAIPDLRCLIVRVRGAVALEVECATIDDAVRFVRAMATTEAAR